MFVCVSLNPAVDKRLDVGVLQVGKLKRAAGVQGAPRGKRCAWRPLAASPTVWRVGPGRACAVDIARMKDEIRVDTLE